MKKLLAAMLVVMMVMGVPVSAGAEGTVDLDGMTLEQLLELQSAISNKIADLKSEHSDHDGGVPLSTYEHSTPNAGNGIPRLEKAKDLAGEFHHDLMVIESNYDRSEEYALNSRFSKLTGLLFIGHVEDGESFSYASLRVYGDGALIFDASIRSDDIEFPNGKQLEVDISGYDALLLEVDAGMGVSYLSNMRLHY